MKKLFVIISIFLFTLFGCSDENDEFSKYDKPGANKDIEGFLTQSLIHNNESREYMIYVPEMYDESTKVPILFNFHGGSGTASGHVYFSDMRLIADTANFILVYPQGLYNVWNNSLSSDSNSKNKTDDFGFVEAMISKISSDYSIDATRVYAMGFSNGADMSHALACVLSDKIAAIVSMGGLLYKHTSENTNPSPKGIMSIHGTNDNERPYYNGIDGYYLSIEKMHEYWISHNNINTPPIIYSFSSKGLSIDYYSYKNSIKNISIDHYKVVDAGHDWLDFNHLDLNTNQLIWNFLSQYDINGQK